MATGGSNDFPELAEVDFGSLSLSSESEGEDATASVPPGFRRILVQAAVVPRVVEVPCRGTVTPPPAVDPLALPPPLPRSSARARPFVPLPRVLAPAPQDPTLPPRPSAGRRRRERRARALALPCGTPQVSEVAPMPPRPVQDPVVPARGAATGFAGAPANRMSAGRGAGGIFRRGYPGGARSSDTQLAWCPLCTGHYENLRAHAQAIHLRWWVNEGEEPARNAEFDERAEVLRRWAVTGMTDRDVDDDFGRFLITELLLEAVSLHTSLEGLMALVRTNPWWLNQGVGVTQVDRYHLRVTRRFFPHAPGETWWHRCVVEPHLLHWMAQLALLVIFRDRGGA